MNTESDSAAPLVVIQSMRIGELPTPERMRHPGMALRGTGRGETLSAMETYPLLIDRLHRKEKCLSDDQHRAGVRITRLHDIALRRNGYGKLTLERLMEAEPDVWEKFAESPSAVNAVDLYHKTMQYLTRDCRRVVSIVCFEQRETYALYDVCFDMLADCLERAAKSLEESS